MKINEIITEAFDQPYKSKWAKGEFGDYDILVKLPDGSPLSITFNHEGDNEWHLAFERGHSQDITGEGDAQRIFATVLATIQKFIKKHKPQQLTFSAIKDVEPDQNSESRAKLYNRLVDRYATSWGYDALIDDLGDQVEYELTRLQPVTEEEFNGIDIDMDIEGDEILVTALGNGRELGHVLFVDEGEYLMPQDLEVDERFQGQGIAAAMYDYVKSKGYKIRRSGQQTDAGAGFWGKHRPEQNVWEDADNGAVEELRAALVTKRDQLQSATDDQVYDIIDRIMTRIARNHGISGKKLHDMWVDTYKQVPDTWIMKENFADGKVKGKSRPGRVRRSGASCNGSVTDLRKRAKNASGERAKMYHWCANMKSGRKK